MTVPPAKVNSVELEVTLRWTPCYARTARKNERLLFIIVEFSVPATSVPDPNPDPPDPHVFGPPGSGSGLISQRCGSGSFYQQAKIARKT